MIGQAHRFHGRSSLRYVLTRGQTIRGQLVALRYVRNDRQQVYRAAVVVSRKVSKSAVVRNRIRRRIYEIVRKNAGHIAEPYDLVFSVYGEEVAKLPHATLQKAVLGQLEKAGVVRGAGPPGANHATIQNVVDGSGPRIHSANQNANRTGETVAAKPGRRKGEAPPGLTSPSKHKEIHS